MASIAQRVGLQCGRSLCCLSLVLCCCTCRADARTNADALVVLLPREVEEIDPRLTGDAYGHKLSRLLFGSLVTIDPDSLRMVPDLATQVEIVSPTGYRVHLRHGLHFSDGSTLDADDVIATFRGVVDPKLGSRYASTYARIAEMEAEDPWTVVFRLRGPHATFLSDLELPIVRAEDAARAMGGAGGAPLIGAGPYVLEQRTSGRIELSANAYWYGGEPRYKAVRFLVVHDDNTRALRLLAGKGDLALNAVPPLLLPLFERDPRFSVHSAHGVGTTYVGLNLEAPALRDVRVRRAIAHAIDREALIRAKLAGRAQLATSWIVPGHWAYADHVAHYDYDPQRARALLRSVKGQDASGPPIHLSLRCGSDRFRQSLAHAIAAMLRDVGLEVDVRPSEVATLIANLNRGRFELTTLEVPEVVEPHVLSWFFGSDHVPGTGNEGANRWRLRSAALDAALERGRAHVEPEIRIAAYADAQRILAEELPVIPLWHEDVVAVEDARARAFHVARLGRFNPLAR